MKYLSLSLSLLLLFVLIVILINQPYKSINTYEELSHLLPNQRVSTSGLVISERIYEDYIQAKLNNNISIQSSSKTSYKGKNIQIKGYVQSYNNNYKIIVKEIKIIK